MLINCFFALLWGGLRLPAAQTLAGGASPLEPLRALKRPPDPLFRYVAPTITSISGSAHVYISDESTRMKFLMRMTTAYLRTRCAQVWTWPPSVCQRKKHLLDITKSLYWMHAPVLKDEFLLRTEGLHTETCAARGVSAKY